MVRFLLQGKKGNDGPQGVDGDIGPAGPEGGKVRCKAKYQSYVCPL